jgi:hypothetical protein
MKMYGTLFTYRGNVRAYVFTNLELGYRQNVGPSQYCPTRQRF